MYLQIYHHTRFILKATSVNKASFPLYPWLKRKPQENAQIQPKWFYLFAMKREYHWQELSYIGFCKHERIKALPPLQPPNMQDFRCVNPRGQGASAAGSKPFPTQAHLSPAIQHGWNSISIGGQGLTSEKTEPACRNRSVWSR